MENMGLLLWVVATIAISGLAIIVGILIAIAVFDLDRDIQ